MYELGSTTVIVASPSCSFPAAAWRCTCRRNRRRRSRMCGRACLAMARPYPARLPSIAISVRATGQLARPDEHVVEHRSGQPAGEGVLLAGVVAAEQFAVRPPASPSPSRRARTPVAARGTVVPSRGQRGPQRGPGEAAQHDEAPRGRREQLQVAHQPGRGRCRARSAVGLLSGGAQCTAARIRVSSRRWPSSADTEVGSGREPGPVQRGEQPVAAAVPGEDPAGAVAAVRRRGQPDQQDPGVRRTPRGHRPSPVQLSGVRRPYRDPSLGDVLPPGDQPGAGPAVDDHPVQRVRVGREVRGDVGQAHASIKPVACPGVLAAYIGRVPESSQQPPDLVETPRLRLQRLRTTHAAALFATVSRTWATLHPWMPWALEPPTPEGQQDFARRPSGPGRTAATVRTRWCSRMTWSA